MENSKNLRLKSILALCAIFLSIPFFIINASIETSKLDAAIKKAADPSLNGHHGV